MASMQWYSQTFAKISVNSELEIMHTCASLHSLKKIGTSLMLVPHKVSKKNLADIRSRHREAVALRSTLISTNCCSSRHLINKRTVLLTYSGAM